MVVALRAADGEAQHAFADDIHAVKHRLHAKLLRVHAALLVDHRVAQESRGHDLVLRGLRQLIARQLLDHKLVVGQIAVVGVHHPVAVKPDEAHRVLLIAVAVCVVRGIQPVARPALAIVRRIQQCGDRALDAACGVFLISCGKGIDLLRRGRQAGQVQVQAAQQRGGVCDRGRGESFFLEPLADEGINGVLRVPWHLRLHRCLEGPVIRLLLQLHARAVRPHRSGVDPLLQLRDLRRAQRVTLARHAYLGVDAQHGVHQAAVVSFSWQYGHAKVAALQRARLVVQPKGRLLLVPAVALVAVLGENGLDVLDEIHRRRCRRGEQQKKKGGLAFHDVEEYAVSDEKSAPAAWRMLSG